MSHVNKVQLEFALDLLRRTTLNSPTKSVVICPVTIANSLAILSYGCRGKTADKLQKALGYVEDDYYFCHYFSGIAKVLCDGSVENMLKIANRLYVPKEFDVMESFQNFVTEKYSNQAHLIDLDSLDEATLLINQFINEKTKGKISNIILDKKLLNHTSMTLINAVHFEGLWHVYFDASETKKELFHVSKTLSREVTMMHKNFTFEYYEDELLQRVNLYCKDEELKMYILLPKQPEKLSEIIQQMSSERFRNIVRPNRPPIYHIDHDHLDFVDLKLPKFSIDSTHDLLPILQQIPTYRTCIEQVSTKSADFNGLTSSPNELCLGQMVQRAVIEICEEECQEKGTWTIPLTRVKTRGDARPPQHHNFHANHPFIFFLADNNYHIFMSGVVGDDQQ